jgi:hypothetical protein
VIAQASARRAKRVLRICVVVIAVLIPLAGCAHHQAPVPAASLSPQPGSTRSPLGASPTPANAPAVAVPSHAAFAAATRYLRNWGHVAALAVVDSQGNLLGFHEHRRFASASVVKAMLLVQYLRTHQRISAGLHADLSRMIVLSDNAATDRVFGLVGARGLRQLAVAAGMRSFVPASPWAVCQTTAADQARFFAGMDKLVPKARRHLVRGLLSTFGPYRGWGIPRLAVRLGWRPFFKDGWIHTSRGESLLQVVRLERGRLSTTVAVFTDGQPTPGYGVNLSREVGWLLLHDQATHGL